MVMRYKRRAEWLAIGSVLFIVPNLTAAAEWWYEPRMSMNMEANTNKRLAATNPRETLGSILDMGIALGIRTDRTDISLIPQGRISRFIGDHPLDNDAASLAFKGEHQWERSAFDLGFTFAKGSTLATELLTTGKVQNNIPVYSISVNPRFSYQLSAKDGLQFFAGRQDISYEGGLRAGYLDYTYDHFGLSESHDFSETMAAFATVDYSIYDVPTALFSQNTYTFQVGASKHLTPTWFVSAAGGFNVSDSLQKTLFPGIEVKTMDTGEIYSFKVSKSFETGSLEARLSSSLTPTSGGKQVNTTAITFEAKHVFSEKWKGILSFSDYRNSNQGSNASSNYQANTVMAETSYRLTRSWSLIGRYTYSRIDSNQVADSNACLIALSYRDDVRSMSR